MQIATNSLNQFLSKREALQIDSAQQQIPWELIDPPSIPENSSGSPVSITQKNTKRQLVVAAVLSFLLSLGFGFLIEILDSVYHTPKEVRNATKLPILGAIPKAKELKQVPKKSQNFVAVPSLATLAQSFGPTGVDSYSDNTQEYSRSPVSEAFRSLYTNISSLGYDKPIHSVVITSATTGDGKSTIAVRLAQTAASIGQRVLLVDADMRQPTIHTKLGLPNIRGFSDAISSDLSLNDAIQRSPSENNLFVLSAGQIPSDPIKLLSSKKRQYLMEQFQAFFDLVIYDTPPMLGLADSPLMAANTDGAILVVRLEKTNSSKVKEALDGFMISGGLILGAVANGIKGH
jgi:capsular exopolysaccharide synthesis family protein